MYVCALVTLIGCTQAQPASVVQSPAGAAEAPSRCEGTACEPRAVSSGTHSVARVPRADYVPELAPPEVPPLGPFEVKLLLQEFALPPDAVCRRWSVPLGTECTLEDGQLWRELQGAPASQQERERDSELLAKQEGCSALPPGALRWLRARRLGKCKAELLEPLLRDGGASLKPWLRELVLGEVVGARCLERVRRQKFPQLRWPFTPERFGRWQARSWSPWQSRVRSELDACGRIVQRLPAASVASAELGRALATRQFAVAPRGATLDARLASDYEQRTAYFDALDELTQPSRAELDEALTFVRPQAARAGDFEEYASSFALLLPARDPLARLALPPLFAGEEPLQAPTQQSSAQEASTLQAPASSNSAPLHSPSSERFARLPSPLATHLLAAELPIDETTLRNLLRRGLSLQVRARVGEALVKLPASDPLRQRLHLLLAHGLVRLGIVIQEPAVLSRARYELEYAGGSIEARWLGAIAHALLTPEASSLVFRRWQVAPEGKLDLERFDGLLRLAEQPRYAGLAVDHALLATLRRGPGLRPDDSIELVRKAVAAAERPGVPLAVQRCVRDWAGSCGWAMDDLGYTRCACSPFPWLGR